MPLQILDSVVSTMDVAREHIVTGRITFNQIGQARYQGVMAREQRAGRGQRGRGWYAQPGESLCATYYFRRGLTAPEYAGQIALLAAVAVAEPIQRLVTTARLREINGAERGPDVGLKWPNDVLLNGRKVGGILVEMVKAPDGEWVALIGVGVNVSVQTFPPEVEGLATSLAREGVIGVTWEELGEKIAASLHAQADLRRDSGFAALLDRWRTYDRTAGRRYQAELSGAVVQGVAVGVDDSGALRLRLDSGEEISVLSASSLQELF